ncbi:MAG: UTRA domain-containing protein [Caulobacteraceae bacterium]|nr:MAG: UTRA domain-containing protein [Caulobacteraceae bacterium]
MSQPLHETIRARLEADILEGRFKPGEKLPNETELAAEWDCARMTISRALGALAEAGMVQRRKRAGTFVARRTVQETVLDIRDVAADIRASGREYSFRRLARREAAASAEDAAALGVAEGAPVLLIIGLHLADGQVHALEERRINLDVAPAAGRERFEDEAPGAWLLAHVAWTEAEHVISAVAADGQTAKRMGISTGSALLSLERKTWLAGDCVTSARFLYPAGAQRFAARLREPGAKAK